MRPRERLAELEARLGHAFARPELLEQALLHRSRAHELGDRARSNERLEFLGDAVLDVAVSELLMELHPEAEEGTLSRARSRLVNARALAGRARALELGRWLRLGGTEEKGGGREKESILADAFEAVLGAVYLDGGLAAARRLVDRELSLELRGLVQPGRDLGDAKSRLQELLQARGEPAPEYVTLEESGPSHAPEFRVEVRVAERVLGAGRAGSKRGAEQAAARRALETLRPSVA